MDDPSILRVVDLHHDTVGALLLKPRRHTI